MTIFLFLLGLSVGSFLNVLIDRLPKGESVIRGRSYCDHCRHKLSWYDLIPLLSFIILGRKCRYCGTLISWQYPIVELITGLAFVYSCSSVYLFIIVSGLIVIFFTDFKYRIIPDQVVFILIITSLLYLILYQSPFLPNHLLSGATMSILFLTLVILTRGKGMGLGDVKFSFFMGIFLGFPKIIVAFYLSFLTGAVVSAILVIAGKKKMKSTIAFGPFLVIATFMSFFYGDQLWNIFKGILGIT